MPSSFRYSLPVAALLAIAFLTACAASAPVIQPGSTPSAAAPVYRGVPGFDTRDYPGDATMQRWRDTSPYRWVGYYLPAPCYTGTTWRGKRASLAQMGWGMAVVFVGEQDWAAMRAAAGDTVATATQNARCTRANLNAAIATANAASADSAVAADAFPAGTVIYLDVERVEQVSPELASYVRTWAGALLDRGRFVPGLYAHERNVVELQALVAAEFQRKQRADQPRVWVASATRFDIAAAPSESALPSAAIWQGVFNRRETWGGSALTVDVNVANSADPSGVR